MRICLVGGIYDKDPYYRARHALTPETNLEVGLRARGIDVVTAGHSAFRPANGFDVIHVHHAGHGALRLAAAHKRAPFVFTGHDGKMLCGYERRPVRRAAFQFIAGRADLLVALSEAERRYLAPLAASQAPVVTIGNGMPTERFPFTPRAPHDGPYRLLYAGQLIPLKGVDVLLDALAQLALPRGVHLDIASQMPTQQDELRQRITSLGLEERVRFLGFLDPDRLAAQYARSDLFVLPSRAESLPSTIAEALLSGTPVVASRVGGIPEQVEGVGETAAPGDASSLAQALSRALSRLSDLQERVRAFQPTLRARLSLDRMTDAHLEAYALAKEAHREVRRRHWALVPAVRLGMTRY